MIAMALACSPRLLIADEPTTALDVMVQAQVLALLAELQARARLALLLITHDLSVLAATCERIAVMYAGRIVEEGPAAKVFEAPPTPTPEPWPRRSRPSATGPRGATPTASAATRPTRGTCPAAARSTLPGVDRGLRDPGRRAVAGR